MGSYKSNSKLVAAVHLKHKSVVEYYEDADPHWTSEANSTPVFEKKFSTELQLPLEISRIDCSAIDLRLESVAIAGHRLDHSDKTFVWLFKLVPGTAKPLQCIAVDADPSMKADLYSKMVCGSLSFIKGPRKNVQVLYV